MYVIILINIALWPMFCQTDQYHEKSHQAHDIVQFRVSPILSVYKQIEPTLGLYRTSLNERTYNSSKHELLRKGVFGQYYFYLINYSYRRKKNKKTQGSTRVIYCCFQNCWHSCHSTTFLGYYGCKTSNNCFSLISAQIA